MVREARATRAASDLILAHKKNRALNFVHSKSTGVDVGAGVGGGTVHSSTPVGLLHPSSQTQVYAAAP